ncbi:Ig-like domain-containing protein [Aliikangiella coralliicola]|uniref:Uncharacterized protein n=1 Tax=Aliikangiella coralliicola TaxID=2592383 RepID=A0A545UC81_9GAMM|nr:Ig-like domain-containing protein [Aliikangiella coralliicola]TQV87070.1 hypothetical protein FLL46_14795 [Aliikangiella coralliicola]
MNRIFCYCYLLIAISLSSQVFASPPGVPQIAWLPETIENGNGLTVEWNMWWGVNGSDWELLDNGNKVCEGTLTPNGENAQKGSCSVDLNSGVHNLQVSLCNSDGCSESAVSVITVGTGPSNKVPTVKLNQLPTVKVGDTVLISATASDSDGSITKVSFAEGANNLGIDTSAPYSVQYEASVVGTYTINVVATDNLGATASASGELVVTEADGGSNGTNLSFEALPLQINVNESATATYIFNQPVTKIISRKSNVAQWEIDNKTVRITGKIPGRTGLKISTATGENYYLGLRINHSDGALPGLPKYLSIGSVSEDSVTDLEFWRDIDTDLTNKNMDIRYIYINGGPMERGWQSWGTRRAGKFAEESIRFGLVPFFVYYNIPDGGESFTTDLEHIRSVDYMNDYFQDIDIFMEQVQEVAQGELYGIILEPDFLGYFQQNGVLHLGTNDPTKIKTVVGKNKIEENAGTIYSLVKRINATIDNKRRLGHKIFFGWQLNLWAYAPTSGNQGVLRRTDDLGWVQGRNAIVESARETTQYGIDAGILTHGADFISIDKYGLDAMIHQNKENPADSTWFFNNDHWMNYLHFVNTMHETSAKPIVLWQLPVGHINGTHETSVYTGQRFQDLNNTPTKGEDSSTTFFFGDSFTVGNSVRLDYFAQNQAQDNQLNVAGNKITWGSHIQEAKDAGVIVALFGAGVGISTDGVGSPPTDDYFWIQKVQSYYQNGVVPLEKEYAKETPKCELNCEPWVGFVSPLQSEVVRQNELSSMTLEVKAVDDDGTINTLSATINGQSISLSATGENDLYSASWTPPAYGNYTLKISALDNDGLSGEFINEFSILSPDTCTLEPWSADVIYSIPGQRVEFEGDAYENKWYASGVNDSPANSEGPWVNLGTCNGSTSGL